MTKALYPATFDPITYGHIDIAQRAARVFDELVVAVFDRPMKKLMFSTEERVALCQQALSHLDNVTIVSYKGLTVHFAQQQEAMVMVRGIRVMSDFEWELQLSLTNHTLVKQIETVCFMAGQEYLHISSSIVKDIALNQGDLTKLAPPMVIDALQARALEFRSRA